MRYGGEIIRKSIHFSSLAVPIGIHFLPLETGRTVILALTLLLIVVDVLRLYVPPLRTLFYFLFGRIVRNHERFNLLGSTYLMMAALISVYAFGKSIAVVSLAFLIVGDTMAALVGRRWGRIRLLDKSLEGSMACLASCLLIGWFYGRFEDPELTLYVAAVGSLTATLAELLPIPLDDNLRIPLAAGFAMSLLP